MVGDGFDNKKKLLCTMDIEPTSSLRGLALVRTVRKTCLENSELVPLPSRTFEKLNQCLRVKPIASLSRYRCLRGCFHLEDMEYSVFFCLISGC